jgi:hypothetical protein
MEKQLFWVAKNREDSSYKPLAFITLASGRLSNYIQPDIDKFLSKNKDLEVVMVEFVEIDKK